jgi:hypothetical protein
MVALRTSPAGFPMAPSGEEWEALSPAEREAVVAALPGEVTYDEMAMPEGDRHAKARALDALRGFFTRQRRRIYFAQELPIYYPTEPRFAPDLLRFYAGTALLLESEELIARVQAMYDAAQRRAEEEALRREEAERLAEEEARRREEAEREVARLRAELERLKR